MTILNKHSKPPCTLDPDIWNCGTCNIFNSRCDGSCLALLSRVSAYNMEIYYIEEAAYGKCY